MLSVCKAPEKYNGATIHDVVQNKTTTKEKMDAVVELLKTSSIKGCITGSYWLPHFDPDNWGTKPDIDIFVFGENELVHAINFMQYALGMEPGKGTERSKKQEQWKLDRLMRQGLNYKLGITTYTFYAEGIMINTTFKQRKVHGHWVPLLSVPDVLQSFDMSIVMQGYDIEHHVFYDMRVGSRMVATPNPLRNHDCTMWTVAKWVRQFDRVVKYYNRGFDTRPMAEFYLEMIDECIEAGCLFDSEESKNAFENFNKEFLEKRAMIADWLDEHKED